MSTVLDPKGCYSQIAECKVMNVSKKLNGCRSGAESEFPDDSIEYIVHAKATRSCVRESWTAQWVRSVRDELKDICRRNSFPPCNYSHLSRKLGFTHTRTQVTKTTAGTGRIKRQSLKKSWPEHIRENFFNFGRISNEVSGLRNYLANGWAFDIMHVHSHYPSSHCR